MNIRLQALVIEYRSPHRTIECVKALLAQSVPIVHVVDNSADHGVTRGLLVEAFAGDDRVWILDAGSNLGFAAGINFGLRHRVSDRVLLINNDALPSAGAISALEASLDTAEDACIAFPSLMHAGRPLERVHYHRWLSLLTNRRWLGAFEVPRGCCMLVSVDRTPVTPLFDEQFFMYGEEIALGWHLHRQGARICHVSAAWVEHAGSATAMRGSPFYEERTALAHLLLNNVLAERAGVRQALAVVRVSMLVLRALTRSLRQRSLLPLHALERACNIARGTSGGTPPPS
jgi:N-acetylglucosaminyl-diphospho-decaprenol L-rhamnosyltransferase